MNYIERLLPPQKSHAVKLLDSLFMSGVGVDMSQTGCGKTYVACAVAKQFGMPVVVICPKIVVTTWHKVAREFDIDPKQMMVINYEKLVRGNTKFLRYNKKKWEVRYKNWTDRGVELNFPHGALVIFDEVHKCKGHNSLNGELLIAVKNHRHPMLMMSATCATNPLEMKALGYAVNLHNGYNYKDFIEDCGADRNVFGGYTINMSADKARLAMCELHNNLYNLQKVASRLTVDDFQGIFPDDHVYPEVFDMGTNSKKIQSVYDQMQAELDMLDERSKNYSEHVFAIIMKARRLAELLKVPMLVEAIEDAFDEGLSPVLFVSFNDTVEAVKERLSKNKRFDNLIGYIVGGQSTKERDGYIADFQADKRRIMIANLAAGNAGISLHDLNGKFPRTSLIVPSFSAINLLQALGRIARQGGKTKCVQRIVFSAGTIEERAAEKVQARLDNLSALNDNDLMSGINIYR